MATVYQPQSPSWQDPTPPGYNGPKGPQSFYQTGPAPGNTGGFDFSKLTPDQQKQYAGLTPAQRQAAWAMGTPPSTLNLSDYFSGKATATGPTGGGAAPTLPANNGDSGSHDTNTINQWLASKGITDPAAQQYWASAINSKSDGLSQANADYWAGRISGGSADGGGGGGGLYGPQNTFTPLSPFGGIGNAPTSSYNPGGISAPQGFQYSPLQGNGPFSFPGVYQPPQPQAPPLQAGPSPQAPPPQPPPDPTQGSPIPNGILVNGGWRDKNDPSPDVQAVVQQYAQAQQQYQTALQQYQAGPGASPSGVGTSTTGAPPIGSSNPNEGIAPPPIGGSNPNEGIAPQVGVNSDPNMAPSGVAGGDRGMDAYYAPGGPGGPPLVGSSNPNEGINQPSGVFTSGQQPAPTPPIGTAPGNGSLYAAGLTLPPYQGQAPFSSSAPPQIAGFTQNGQINAPSVTAPNPLIYQPLSTPSPYQTPTPLTYDPLQTPGIFQGGTFTAPTAEEAASDPGYQFALNQAQQALQQSAAARGGLNSTGTQKALADYTQQAAGQQYQSVYARDLAAFQAQQALNQSAYGLNTGTQLAAQGQQYAQAANTQAQNAAQGLAGYQTNAQTGLAANAQQFGQAATAQGQNAAQDLTVQQANAANSLQAQQNSYANALAGYQTNVGTQLGAQQQGYAQAANTYGLNAQTGQGAYALNAQTQLGAQNQAFNQAFNTYNANNANSLALQQANFQNAYNVYQGNFGNQLNAYQATTGAGQAAAALNAQTANQAWQNNYTQAWNAYQSQVQQQEAAAGLGFQYAGLGLQQQNQLYNQAANTYGINYNALYQQPFNNNLSIAQLGYGAATNPYGQNYANNAGNIYQGIGNAYAGATIGAANAYAGGLANLYNGLSPYAYGYGTKPTPQPQPFAPNTPTWGGY